MTLCNPDLVLRDVRTGTERVLAAERRTDAAMDQVERLAWAPGSRLLAVTMSYEGRWTGLVDTDRATTLAPERLAGGDHDTDAAAWLGDGRLVIVWSCCYPEHERNGLALLDRSGGEEALSDDRTRAMSPAVDPLGRHLAYVSLGEDGRRTDVVVRRDLGPPQVVTDGYADLDW